MTHEEAIAIVKDALAEINPAKAAEFGPDKLDTKIRDMGIDSVAAMEMVGVVEERLETTFPDEDLAQLNTFNDLVSLVKSA